MSSSCVFLLQIQQRLLTQETICHRIIGQKENIADKSVADRTPSGEGASSFDVNWKDNILDMKRNRINLPK